MRSTDIPAKFVKAFAKNAGGAFVRAIPVTTTDPAAASLDLGFPPETAVPEGAGGTPPSIKDFNGILQQSTAWAWWQAAGGTFPPYDATFQSAVGGYPAGSIVASAVTFGRFWLCLSEANTSNPESGGGGWFGFFINKAPTSTSLTTPGLGTYNTPAGCVRLRVRMVGAGGGGGGTSTGTGVGGGGGGATLFGATTVGAGGGGGTNVIGVPGDGGLGGTGGVTGLGTEIIRIAGSRGGQGLSNTVATPLSQISVGGVGGQGPFAGAGQYVRGAGGLAANPFTGSGGGGASSAGDPAGSAGGGGSGEYVEFYILNPGSYVFQVGAGGLGGVSPFSGGAGAGGLILVDEYYSL